MAHAPGPWTVGEPDGWDLDEAAIYDRDDDRLTVAEREEGGVMAIADAKRAVACVNACAGINPEAVPEMLEVLRAVQRSERAVRSGGNICPLLDRETDLMVNAAIAKAKEKHNGTRTKT